MRAMNPVSPMEHKEQEEEDSFLSGSDAPEAAPSPVVRSNRHPVKKEKP